VAGEIWRAEGVRGFYRGLGVTVLRAIPANATIFAAFELASRLLHLP
jgi:ornithine carrier protein